MDSARQKKVNALLRAVVSEIVLNKFRASGYKNHVVSVTGVRISADLSVARVSVSVFPYSSSVMVLQSLKSSRPSIKKGLSEKLGNELRRIPDLLFFTDSSVENANQIQKSLSEKKNPLI